MEEEITKSANFPPGCSILSCRCFAFLKHTQVIFAGYVEAAPGKPQTGRVILKILPVTGKAKFSLGEWKKSTGSGSTASVTER